MERLKEHLREENPLLVDVVGSFGELDTISRKIGFFGKQESYAARIPWWPVISVLGLYSSGKSAFINHYLDYRLQATGSQAVDDKFTVICFTSEESVRTLPGLALDADPRFPFFRISLAIEEVSPGEGNRIDAYLRLKTCPSERLRGKILIDSPGFDADAQRTSILRITNHIMDLSDLVLVFFDARHPEPGSMSDTLDHLVNGTIHRHDSNKFLYILNQIDATAHEDNPENIFASWQRALAQHGLTAGRCYMIYNPEFDIPVASESLRARFESKRDTDLSDIYSRIEQVKVERAYRIVGILEQTARGLEKEVIPRLGRYQEAWRRLVLNIDMALASAALIAFFAVAFWRDVNIGALRDGIGANPILRWFLPAALVVSAGAIHFYIRRSAARRMLRKMLEEVENPDHHSNYTRAFQKNTRWWRSIFRRRPSGAGKKTFKALSRVVDEANRYVQRLNDVYTNPSGEERVPTGRQEPPHPI